MSPISSGISPDNINLGPASFGYPPLRTARTNAGGKDNVAFNEALTQNVNALKASVSEPLRSEGIGSVVKDFILEVDGKEKVAQSMRTAVLTGESTNLHRTMIASQEASLSFSLMLEMRNKVMETYQELIRLQL